MPEPEVWGNRGGNYPRSLSFLQKRQIMAIQNGDRSNSVLISSDIIQTIVVPLIYAIYASFVKIGPRISLLQQFYSKTLFFNYIRALCIKFNNLVCVFYWIPSKTLSIRLCEDRTSPIASGRLLLLIVRRLERHTDVRCTAWTPAQLKTSTFIAEKT